MLLTDDPKALTTAQLGLDFLPQTRGVSKVGHTRYEFEGWTRLRKYAIAIRFLSFEYLAVILWEEIRHLFQKGVGVFIIEFWSIREALIRWEMPIWDSNLGCGLRPIRQTSVKFTEISEGFF